MDSLSASMVIPQCCRTVDIVVNLCILVCAKMSKHPTSVELDFKVLLKKKLTRPHLQLLALTMACVLLNLYSGGVCVDFEVT